MTSTVGLNMMTNKQKAFVSEYLVDLCATKAAIRAGYSAKRADAIGHENLRKPEIKAAIQLAMKQREERTQVTQDYVLSKIRDTIERCSGDDGAFNPQSILKGCELLGKHLGLFEKDNRQRNPADAIGQLIAEIQANSKRSLPSEDRGERTHQ